MVIGLVDILGLCIDPRRLLATEGWLSAKKCHPFPDGRIHLKSGLAREQGTSEEPRRLSGLG